MRQTRLIAREPLAQEAKDLQSHWKYLFDLCKDDNASIDLLDGLHFKHDDAENTHWKQGISTTIMNGDQRVYKIAQRFVCRNAEIFEAVSAKKAPRMLLENKLGVLQVDASNESVSGLARIITTGGCGIWVVRDAGLRVGDEDYGISTLWQVLLQCDDSGHYRAYPT